MNSHSLRLSSFRVFTFATVAMAILLDASNGFSQGQHDTVLTTSSPFPGGGSWGALWNAPGLSDQGWLELGAFAHMVSGEPGNLQLRMKSGQPVTGGTISSFGLPGVFNDSGDAFGLALLTGSAATDRGLYLSNGGALVEVARKGGLPPGGGTQTYETLNAFALNNSGHAVFSSQLTGASNHRANYLWNGTSVIELARLGSVASTETNPFVTLGSNLHVNNGGQISYWGQVSNGSTIESVLYLRESSGALTDVVRTGDAAPDADGSFSTIGRLNHDLNDAGQLAFSATLTGTANTQGIFTATTGGGVVQVARSGMAAPDANGTFLGFHDTRRLTLNASGQVAFEAELIGTTNGATDNSGIFVGDGTLLKQIAREGQSTPGSNGEFAEFSKSGTDGYASLNDAGVAAFYARLTGTSGGSSDNEGIYVGDGIDLIEVVRLGDTVNGTIVNSLDWNLHHLTRSGNGGFNNFGQVAYLINPGASGEVAVWTPDLHWRSTGNGTWGDPSNWTLGLSPGSVHDTYIDTATNVFVTGPGNDVTVRNFHLGGAAGNPVLDWQSGVTMTANSMNIHSGTLSGGGNFVSPTIMVHGPGAIDVPFDEMYFTTTQMDNHGTISVDSGYVEVNGNLMNHSGGSISLDNESFLYVSGDFDNQGMVQMFIGGLDVDGIYSGTGAISGSGFVGLFGVLAPGNSAASIEISTDLYLDPNAVSEFELGGEGIGEFDQIFGMDNFEIGGTLEVSLINGFTLDSDMSFLIADVDGFSTGQFTGLGEGDLVGNFSGQNLYITYSAGNGFGVALYTVPEPTAAGLVAVALIGWGCLRRRRRFTA